MKEKIEIKEITKKDFDEAIREYKKNMTWKDHLRNVDTLIFVTSLALILCIIFGGWLFMAAIISGVSICLFMRYVLGIIIPHEAVKVLKILINKTSKG